MGSIKGLFLFAVAGLMLGGLLLAAEPERRQLFNGKDLEDGSTSARAACTSRTA